MIECTGAGAVLVLVLVPALRCNRVVLVLPDCTKHSTGTGTGTVVVLVLHSYCTGGVQSSSGAASAPR